MSNAQTTRRFRAAKPADFKKPYRPRAGWTKELMRSGAVVLFGNPDVQRQKAFVAMKYAGVKITTRKLNDSELLVELVDKS